MFGLIPLIAEVLGVSTEVVAAGVIGGAVGTFLTAGLLKALASEDVDKVKEELRKMKPEQIEQLKKSLA